MIFLLVSFLFIDINFGPFLRFICLLFFFFQKNCWEWRIRYSAFLLLYLQLEGNPHSYSGLRTSIPVNSHCAYSLRWKPHALLLFGTILFYYLRLFKVCNTLHNRLMNVLLLFCLDTRMRDNVKEKFQKHNAVFSRWCLIFDWRNFFRYYHVYEYLRNQTLCAMHIQQNVAFEQNSNFM